MPDIQPASNASCPRATSRERNTAVRITDCLTIGDGDLTVIAGPCAVEGHAMLLRTARAVQSAGAIMLRGGVFKPRTSPYSFRGLGAEALEMLAAARAETGLAIVCEVMDASQLPALIDVVDVLQIGARNMQNYTLLTAAGECGVPVLLKRGMSATIGEFLLAAEYVLAHGNPNVILCERGIRTFETATRNTLDVAAVPVLKKETYLPVLVDPSHAGGRADLVLPLSLAAVAAGADGLLIEVHPDPATALSDGPQSLTFDAFDDLMARVKPLAYLCGRPVATATRGQRQRRPRRTGATAMPA
ncbi:MAG: Phospho-2-dehydro-3-deoxyheptonate aldolase [Gemmatimonadaceae bacterium]|nr:Phospho-2-dehydro-3-deoxyheptonate aldolase [Gemmatimonadaceae bacterium]